MGARLGRYFRLGAYLRAFRRRDDDGVNTTVEIVEGMLECWRNLVDYMLRLVSLCR